MKNKLIVGSALGLAAIAVAIDHTKHRLPEPQQAQQDLIVIEGEDNNQHNVAPCGLTNVSPCSL